MEKAEIENMNASKKENSVLDEKVGMLEDMNVIVEGDGCNILSGTTLTKTSEDGDEEKGGIDSEFKVDAPNCTDSTSHLENCDSIQSAIVPASTHHDIGEENLNFEFQTLSESESEIERRQCDTDDDVPLSSKVQQTESNMVMDNDHANHFTEENEIVRKVFQITSSPLVLQNNTSPIGGCEWSNAILNSCQPIGNSDIETITSLSGMEKMQEYRCEKPLVLYSDSEGGSDNSYSDLESEPRSPKLESSFGDEEDCNDSGAGTDNDVNDNDGHEKRKKNCPKGNNDNRLRTRGEVFPEELPPLDYLTISASEEVKLEPLGTISGIVGVLVVIEAVDACPALFDDTVLFLENRQPLGLIFETMGTIQKPFYTVRFNSNDDIVNKGISIGDKVMFAPDASNLTKFVFIAELKRRKYVDASWESDNEPPEGMLEYSDDEEERKARREKKGPGSAGGGRTKRKKRSAKKRSATDGNHNVTGSSSNSSGLPQGPMNRNPFGDPTRAVACLPNKQSAKHPPKYNGSNSSNATASNSSNIFPSNRNNPQPPAKFGDKPSWQEPPWTMGPPRANNNTNKDNHFNFEPPSFHPLPPVYNTTSHVQSAFGNRVGQAQIRGSGFGNAGHTHPHRPPCPPIPPPHTGSFSHNPNNQFIMPPRFNTNIPPPPLPGMFSQFTQPQPPCPTNPPGNSSIAFPQRHPALPPNNSGPPPQFPSFSSFNFPPHSVSK